MIPINLIRQYHFCPRIVYFSLLTNIKPIYPRHVALGVEYHKLQEKLSKNRKFKKLDIKFNEVVLDKYIENEKLNICGIVDIALISPDEIVPVEFKDILSKKPTYSHILQLYGYGLLLSLKYDKKFHQAYISYSNNMKLHKITITTDMKDDFDKTIKNIQNIIDNDVLPHSSAGSSKCSQCEYINYCDDRF